VPRRQALAIEAGSGSPLDSPEEPSANATPAPLGIKREPHHGVADVAPRAGERDPSGEHTSKDEEGHTASSHRASTIALRGAVAGDVDSPAEGR